MEEENLKNQTLDGVSWRGFSTVLQFVLSLFLTVFFMQFLLPEDYGLIAKLVIILSLFNIFLDFGYSQAIVQYKNVSDKFYSSQFYWNVLIGFSLAIIFILIAPLIADFYKDDRLKSILYIFSLTFILGGSIIVHRAILHRKMAFKKLAIIELSSFLISGIVAVFLVWYGYGYKAILAQMLLSISIQFILFWSKTSFKLSSYFDFTDIKNSTKFSFYIFLSRFTSYLIELLDQFLISVYYPANTLGAYNRAASIIRTPVTIIPGTISQVLFPLFSSIVNDEKKSNRSIIDIYTRSHNLIILMFIPIWLVCYFQAEFIIDFMFPDEWKLMIPYFKMFAIIASIVVTSLEASVILGYGKSKLNLLYTLPGSLIIITALVVGIQYGIMIMLYGLLVGSIINKLLQVRLLINQFDLSLRDFLNSLIVPILFVFLIVTFIQIALQFIDLELMKFLFIIIFYLIAMLIISKWKRYSISRDLNLLIQKAISWVR